ncbi:MAG: sugar transferase [Parcubacteria group bacterium]|nr:sugar transferase [Parcubacteria group bacterium]
MKKSELAFTAALVPVDFLMIILAAVITYFIRFSDRVVEIWPVQFNLPLRQYLLLAIVVTPVWLLIFALLGLYNPKKKRRLVDDLYSVFVGVSTGVMGIVLYIFLRAELFSSRFLVLVTWLLAIILIVLGRSLIRWLQHRLYKYNYGVHRVVLIGDTSAARHIKDSFQNPLAGYKIVGILDEVNGDTLQKLEQLSRDQGVDEIIQTDPAIPKIKVLELIDFADERKIDMKYIPDLFGTEATNIEVRAVAGFPLVEFRRTPLDGWGKIIKRIIDVVGATLGLIFLLPLFVAVAITIKLNTPGTVLVRLKRVGRDGEFDMFKFRSMVKDAHKMKKDLLKFSERQGPLFKMKNDPRITRVGRFLRKTRIDELPQLLNVLKDDMSLIGPRPHEPEEVAQYQKHQRKVLAIKPGMTGMGQVSGASDLSFAEEVKLDTYYIENWALKMDLQILLRTVKIVLQAEAAH